MDSNENRAAWFDIPYTTLTFCLRFYGSVEVPEQKVSALRGGLGEMLLQKNCVVDRKCEICRFRECCIVWNAFYTPMRLKPDFMTGKESLGYLIECDNNETYMDELHGFVFRLKLFGRNIPLFSQYLDAFWRLGQNGIGKKHARYEIMAVFTENEEYLMDNMQLHMDRFQIRTVGEYIEERKRELGVPNGVRTGSHYNVRFITPLALRKDRIDLDHFDAEAIWRAVHRKIQMMSYFVEAPLELEKPMQWPAITESKAEKAFMKRYSNTHKKGMELKGIQGYAVLKDINEKCLEELLAGELFHIGRNNSFDFGRYQVENIHKS